MPSNYKPLTFNTSIRNPERAKYFLKTIIKFENEIMEGAACHRADRSPSGLRGGYALPSKPGDAFRDY